MHPLVQIAFNAARRAGDVIIRGYDRLDTVKISEKSHNDFVTDIDKKAEQEIIYTIHKAYPKHGIIAEESENIKGDDYTWVIDPLDGTNNFVHGFPHFAVSIAIKHKDRLEHGLIHDPLRNETFFASRGQGANLNQRRIRVGTCHDLGKAFLATGLPAPRKNTHLDAQMQTLQAITKNSAAIRRTGSAALDLAYVAAGRLDGYWEYGLEPWDLAAGVLLVKEAGGIVTDFAAKEDFFENGCVIATNVKLLKPILQTVQVYFKTDAGN